MAIVVDKTNIGEVAIDTASTTIVLTTTQTVAANGFIVLALTWFGSAITLSSVAGGSLTWAIDKTGVGTTTPSQHSAIVTAQAPAGLASGTTITATLSGAGATGARSMCGTSFLGVLTASALDTAPATVEFNATTAWATPSTTIQAGSVLIALGADFATNSASTPTSPSIEAHDVNGGAGTFDATTVYRIEPAAGSYTVAGTWAAADSGIVIAAAYKAAPSGVRPRMVRRALRPIRARLARRKPLVVRPTRAVTTATPLVRNRITVHKANKGPVKARRAHHQAQILSAPSTPTNPLVRNTVTVHKAKPGPIRARRLHHQPRIVRPLVAPPIVYVRPKVVVHQQRRSPRHYVRHTATVYAGVGAASATPARPPKPLVSSSARRAAARNFRVAPRGARVLRAPLTGGISRQFAATVTGVGTVTAQLRVTRGFSASVAGVGTVSANLLATRGLRAAAAGTSTVTANLTEKRALAATVAGTSVVTANLGLVGVTGPTLWQRTMTRMGL